jgi:hypothetical protein
MCHYERSAVKVDSIIANRLGLLLSFLAGFLLAPELIGQERLARLEEWLEERAGAITKFMQTRRREGIKQDRASVYRLFRRESPPDGMVEPTEHEYSFAYSAKQLLGCYLIPLAVGTLVVVMVPNWFVRVILLPILALPLLVFGLVALWGTGLLVLRLLKGSNRLRTLMVLIGLCLYVIGNLLQFWATF